eukprot:4297316-Lingulodinium_polyedra.AAC.1
MKPMALAALRGVWAEPSGTNSAAGASGGASGTASSAGDAAAADGRAAPSEQCSQDRWADMAWDPWLYSWPGFAWQLRM